MEVAYRPIFSTGEWYIEVETKDLGKVLLLDKESDLAIPVRFPTKEEALKYIFENNIEK